LDLARSYQITSVFLRDFTVLENVALAVQRRTGTSYRFWQPLKRETALFDEASEIVCDIGLGGDERRQAATLAHRQQRQLEIGLALAAKPRMLLLDEPMAGVSGEESHGMVELLERLKGSITMLLVEHDMDAVCRLADRISVLVYGRVIATGAPEEIRSNTEVRAVRTLATRCPGERAAGSTRREDGVRTKPGAVRDDTHDRCRRGRHAAWTQWHG
jgi:branched-chain amino acid transport system ATP-binding protein